MTLPDLNVYIYNYHIIIQDSPSISAANSEQREPASSHLTCAFLQLDYWETRPSLSLSAELADGLVNMVWVFKRKLCPGWQCTCLMVGGTLSCEGLWRRASAMLCFALFTAQQLEIFNWFFSHAVCSNSGVSPTFLPAHIKWLCRDALLLTLRPVICCFWMQARQLFCRRLPLCPPSPDHFNFKM